MSVKTAGVGHFQIPTAPAAGVAVTSGAANVLTATAIVLSASTGAIYITGVHVEAAAASAATYKLVQLCIGGAGAETSIGQYLVPLSTGSTVALGFHPIFPPIPVANATRLTVKTADSVGSQATLVTCECILQSNVVDDGITVGTVALVTTATTVTTTTTVTNQLTAAAIATGVWQDAVSGDFTTASSIGKALYIANVVPGGTGGHFIAGTNAATTITTGLTTTFTGNLTGSVASVTGQLTAAQVATGVWQDTTAGDFTTALSVGKSVMNGVALGTGLTVAAVSGAVGSVTGAVGSVTGLTASNLDATISSRMATYTQPTGFLAATFPTGTVANTTNVTAGTITTVTNLTNAPTAGDLTATMKTSVTTAATAATPIAASVSGAVGSVTGAVGSVTGNVGGNVVGSVASVTAAVSVTGDLSATMKTSVTTAATAATPTAAAVTGNVGGSVASVVGLTAANLDATVSSRLATAGYTAPDNADVVAIKAKTDSLTFTKAGEIDANIQSVNDTTVTGNGGVTPWGP